jgi:glycosyltransferase involved in cell wall biosynthesis
MRSGQVIGATITPPSPAFPFRLDVPVGGGAVAGRFLRLAVRGEEGSLAARCLIVRSDDGGRRRFPFGRGSGPGLPFTAAVPVFGPGVRRLTVELELMDGALHELGSVDVATHGSPPLVSVVIPCFGQAHRLAEAMSSVARQEHREIEVIVVDDGSQDNTAVVARSFLGATVIEQANGGPAVSRNTGLRHALGEYVLFLDADDRLAPHAIARGVAVLQSHPEAGFVTGHTRHVDAVGNEVPRPDRPCVDTHSVQRLLRNNDIETPGCVLARRSMLLAVGGFACHRFDGCEDYELYLRLLRSASGLCHHRHVVDYTQHAGSFGGNPQRMLRSWYRVLERHGRSIDPLERKAARVGRANAWFAFGSALYRSMREQVEAAEYGGAARSAWTLFVVDPGRCTRLVGAQVLGARRHALFGVKPVSPHPGSAREDFVSLSVGQGPLPGQSAP